MKKVNREVVHVSKDTFLKCLYTGKTSVQNKYFNEYGTPGLKKEVEIKRVMLSETSAMLEKTF